MSGTPDSALTAEDRLVIADAMYHPGAGIDENSAEHLARAAWWWIFPS